MDFSLETYYPVFIYFVFVAGFAVAAVTAPMFLSPRKTTPVKEMPYESGMDPIGDARQRFDVKFYIIAILFLVFDVELLFLFPWAAAYSEGTITGEAFRNVVLAEVLMFIGSVVVAYIYAWRKGVFQWR